MEIDPLVRLLAGARAISPLAPITSVRLTLPQLELGQVVRAQIASRLADGSFHVVIDGTALRMTLAADARPGDVLSLRLVAREPQLQFEHHGPAPQAAAVTKAIVSNTGRLISQVLSEPAATPPRPTLPVIATPVTESDQLREPLARAVERSGLFYESHQARWIRGDFPIERLREEPQATIARTPGPIGHDVESSPAGHTLLPAIRPQLPIEPNDPLVGSKANAATPGTATSLVAEPRTSEPVARETLPLVRQQLDALETRHMSWHGEVWPGQLMHWEIAEHERESAHSSDERDWQTRIAMSLPALGDVGAALNLGAEGIRITLDAADLAAASAMQAGLQELKHALESAGLNVVAVQVRSRDAVA